MELSDSSSEDEDVGGDIHHGDRGHEKQDCNRGLQQDDCNSHCDRGDAQAPPAEFESLTPQLRHITSLVTEGAISLHSIPVSEREHLLPATFERIRPDDFEPLLLKGETREWPAHQRWTFEFFAAGSLGQTAVLVTGKNGKRSDMKLCEYVVCEYVYVYMYIYIYIYIYI